MQGKCGKPQMPIYFKLGNSLIIFNFRGTLEGVRQKPEYDQLLADPLLKYSGLYEEGCADLIVVCQVYDRNVPLALPITTSYKAFTSRWK